MVLSTVDSPLASDVSFNAPNFIIRVAGAEIPLGVRQLVKSCEYESVDGYADALKVNVMNPHFIPPKFASSLGALGGLGSLGGSPDGGVLELGDTKIFQPGNEITLAMGYGSQLLHVGRGIIRRARQKFPQNDTPSIEVVAYTKDSAMMDNAPAKSKKKKGKGGRAFKDKTFSQAVEERAKDYDFKLDIDPTPDAPHNFIQKAGLTDYDFVNGLSHLTGFLFWVDGDQSGNWTLHFKDPEKLRPDDVWPNEDENPREFTFKYADGRFSSLLDFEPDLAIQGATTELKAQVKLANGKVILAEFKEDNTAAPETTAHASAGTLRVVDQALGAEHTTASSVKLFLDDFSIDVRANRRFETQAELIQWARQWFRRQRENFVLCRGKLVGVEQLRARQIHKLQGIGKGLNGEYQFTRVRLMMDNNGGFEVDFSGRKRVPAVG